MTNKIAVMVSADLFYHVQLIYRMVLDHIASEKVKRAREDLNIHTVHGLPAYILAVATVEAFVNEMFLSSSAQHFLGESPLWSLSTEWLEKTDLKQKLILLPQLAFSQSFRRDEQPYQDMKQLIKVRNDLVHYKMQCGPPKYLRPLEDRHIALRAPNLSWVQKLSSSEGIRWAHNTACATIHKLVSFVPLGEYRELLVSLAECFSPISDSQARDWFAKLYGPDLDECI